VAKVFVSYASKDRECAGQLHRWLVAAGHEVFLAHDLRDGIAGGDQWRLRLYEQLRWADAVVCVLTRAYVASVWCATEVAIAQSRGSRLVPILDELGVVHPLLSDVQHIDRTCNPADAYAALAEALRRVDAAGGFGWPDGQSPFPGLLPFGVEQHRVFFGRGEETKELAELLRSPAEQVKAAVVLVVGPSGCGKSSLVRAGLVHRMAQEPQWRTLPPILPGTDPVGAVARELAAVARQLRVDWTVAKVRHQLDTTGLTGLADELLLKAQARRLLLVVDQFEELLTQASPDERARFAELLRPALGGPVQVVATLRPEYLDQLLVDAALRMLPAHTYTLRPLHREGLRLAIREPARLAGIGVNDDLVAQLVADTESGEALPLLAFTLAQLAEGVGRGGQLSAVRYKQLGGVQGALTRQADAALAEASAASGRGHREVIAGLVRLVTVDELGRPTRWRVPRDELPELVTRELDVFVTRRLLTTDTDNDGVVMGVAHEAFLTAWAPLDQAIEENVSALRARRAVEQAATEWTTKGCPPARLWERGQLAAALADTGAHLHIGEVLTDRVELSRTACEFLRTSIRREHFRRRRTITALSVLLVLALAAAGIALVRQRTAEQQRNVAVSRQVAGQALELRDSNPALAAQLGLAAYRLAPTMEARSSLLSTVANPDATRLNAHINSVKAVAVSPNGRVLATGSDDHTARLWDISNFHRPSPLSTLTGHTNYVSSVAFSPDGHTLATGSDDHTARLWDVSDPQHPTLLGSLAGHTDIVYSVAFSPDGHTLATTSADTTARLWDVSDLHQPHPLSTLTGHTDDVNSVAFSPDGHTLATASADRSARLWDVRDPYQPVSLGILTGHTSWVSSVAFSPDEHTLATASWDRTVRLWDVSDPRQPHPLSTLTGHTDTVRSVAFSPDGRTLATASQDTTVRLWDVSDPRQPHTLGTFAGHTNIVYSVAFSPDGHTVASGSYDTTVRLWWGLPGPVLASHEKTVSSVAFSPDGHTLATAGEDRTARLWDVHDPRHPSPLATLTGHTSRVSSMAFSSDGRTLATASYDNTVRLWDVSDPRRPNLLGTLTGPADSVRAVAVSPDGNTLATAGDDGTARLWDVHDPRHPSLLAALTGHTGGINTMTFSPDGHTLATAGDDRTARLWNVHNPRRPSPLGTLNGHTGGINAVAFNPDGHTLATGSADHTTRLWETNIDDATARLCAIAWPTITTSEWDRYLPDLPYQPPCP
jgi:WD40 repeat protein